MTLGAGARFGPYEVIAPIGSGGMGEVYRARDIRLARDVAIKVLPDEFSRDSNRIARFRREAKLLAALSHANIATLYGLEESSGRPCLVMELVEGETLAERIARGPLPTTAAIRLFQQVSAGLGAAHERGILHRDLKPANIKVTSDGTARILDFGLAKMLADEGVSSQDSRAPTLTKGSALGVILGTPSYMSPEQARGEEVDRRTDIWAFGCCLFEALTGKKAFPGETVTDVLASIARDEPPWDELPGALSPAIRRLLRRCLEKDRTRRIHHIADAALELEDAYYPRLEERLSKPFKRIHYYGWMLGALVLGAVLAGFVFRSTGRPVPPNSVARLQMVLSHGPLAISERPSLAISPDGSHIAYVGTDGETAKLYVRAIDSLEARPIQGSEGASGPFFSPDGGSVGFFTGAELRRASLTGAGSHLVTGSPAVTRGAWWASKDMIYLTPTNAHGVVRESITRGKPEICSAPDPSKDERSHSWPQVLPGEKFAIVTVLGMDSSSYESASIAVLDLETRRLKTVLEGGYHGRVVPSGHLLYLSSGNLMAAPFSLSRLAVTGPATKVVSGVMSDARTGGAYYAVSQTGTLVYARGAPLHIAENRLMWVDRKGRTEAVSGERRVFRWPRLSPDGLRLAVSIEGPSDDVWVFDLARGTLSRVTFESRNFAPLWTPDGSHLVFSSTRAFVPNLMIKEADGSGAAEPFVEWTSSSFPAAFMPNGQLAFMTGVVNMDIRVASSTGETRPLLDSRFNEMSVSVSPHGKWLAFASDESGTSEVYVQPYPGPGGKTRVSTNGGTEPIWSHSGMELFYRNGDEMIAVPMTVQPSLRVGKPMLLFEGSFEPSVIPGLRNYDVSGDDRRFVMLEPLEQHKGPRELQVVLDWFDELEHLVPTGN
jgi:serine/threonine protein kinase/Tol biopolymer transport system component